MAALFARITEQWGRLDAMVHSVAFAPKADLQGGLLNSSAEGFARAMDVSCHSFIRMARRAVPLMTAGGTMFAMSYDGANRVVPNYNLMGPVKAALEASLPLPRARTGAAGDPRARDLAGAAEDARGVGAQGLDLLLAEAAGRAPLGELVDIMDVGFATAYLATPRAPAVRQHGLRGRWRAHHGVAPAAQDLSAIRRGCNAGIDPWAASDVTEDMLRDKLKGYASVNSVELVRDGDPNHPWAWVDLGGGPVHRMAPAAPVRQAILRRQRDALVHPGAPERGGWRGAGVGRSPGDRFGSTIAAPRQRAPPHARTPRRHLVSRRHAGLGRTRPHRAVGRALASTARSPPPRVPWASATRPRGTPSTPMNNAPASRWFPRRRRQGRRRHAADRTRRAADPHLSGDGDRARALRRLSRQAGRGAFRSQSR